MNTKLIMESWRRFLKENKEQYITLDENQLIPEFLKIDISEKILSEEKDPQALSIEELESKPGEFYKQQLADMKNAEKKTKEVEQKIQQDNDLNRALKFANYAVEDFEADMVDLGSITDFYNWSIGIVNSIFGKDIKTSKEKLKALQDKRDEIANKIKNTLISVYNPFQREIFRAINLFTGGNFEQIRDPETFDPIKARVFNMVNDGIRDIFMPTKETYKKAKIILKKLAGSNIKPVETWRGFAVDEKSGKYPGLETYSIGKVIDVPNLSSFSIVKDVAEGFAYKEGPSKGRWGIVFYVPKTYRGVDVDFLSQYEGAEKEIISYGKFKMKKMEYISEDGKINVSFNNLQDLKSKPNYSEEWKELGMIYVTVEMLEE